jgi:hypothetical protein
MVLHLLGSKATGGQHQVFGQALDRFQVGRLRGRGRANVTHGLSDRVARPGDTSIGPKQGGLLDVNSRWR